MTLDELCDDLLAERAALITLLEPLDDGEWRTATPAPGWTILDQVTHLAFFDEKTQQAVVDPDGFRASLEDFMTDVDGAVDRVRASLAHLEPAACLAWLRHTGESLVAEVRGRDKSERVPWYGPEMSLASTVTARIMETWAHGQDVADALGAARPATRRLEHIAFLGFRGIPNSYVAHGRPVPDTPVRVELGDVTFGPDDAENVVRGSLLDFCLVVTQRRHPTDTTLVAEGPVAAEWLSIAQAFAGPPGAGREPGQFA